MKPESWKGAYQLKVQMTITLLALFLSFVIIDVATTQWLAINSPGGIANEINPIGIMLYNNFGTSGMVFPKFGIFCVFAAMSIFFTTKYAHMNWFIEFTQSLVLIQIAISLIASFNNFVAILATLYVRGIWPIIDIPREGAILGIFIADLGLGSALANGIMYIWGITKRKTHLKVFVSLVVFVAPVLLFAEDFGAHIYVFAIYVAAASLVLGAFFYYTEKKNLSRLSSEEPKQAIP